MSAPRRVTLPDGRVRWVHRFDLPPDWETGRRRSKQVSGRTSAACLAREREIRAADAHARAQPPAAQSLATYLAAYIADVAPLRGAREKRRGTNTTYGAWARHIAEPLGAIRLDRLTPARLQAWVADLERAGAAPTSIANYGNLLRAALNHAVATGVLASSPLRGVEFPRLEVGGKPVWDREQLARFLALARADDLHPIWVLAAMTGMREGELVALRWEHVDLEQGRLAVALSSRRANAGETRPKSERVRAVWLDEDTCAELAAHQAEQAVRRAEIGARLWTAGERVCTTAIGRPVAVSTLLRHMQLLCAAADAPYITFHGIRRSHVTRLADAGWDLALIAKRVGHADERVTRRHYWSVEDATQQRLAGGVRDALLPEAHADTPRKKGRSSG